MDDFKTACKPKKIHVTGDFHPRGGIKTIITSGDKWFYLSKYNIIFDTLDDLNEKWK